MQHELLLRQIVEHLKDVQGLKAIVLGGSYATGSQRPDSDIDLGLYYYEQQPPDIENIRSIASTLNDVPDPVVTGLGEWGTWVNGGAWLTIQGRRIDFLYRNIDFVSSTIDDCNNGIIRSDYWQQPAYGFHSFMYCTETAINQPLYDPEHIIEQLKTKVVHYSPQLKQAIIKKFLWSARFTLDNAYKPAARGDIYFVTGCLVRAIHCLVQVLYALNEAYYISEKKLAQDVSSFRIQPENFVKRIEAILLLQYPETGPKKEESNITSRPASRTGLLYEGKPNMSSDFAPGTTGTTNIRLMGALAKTETLYSEVSALREG